MAGLPMQNWMMPGETLETRLAFVIDMMREMSSQTDPTELVAVYVRQIRKILPADRSISLSRRDLVHPQVRITRSTTWAKHPNPWREQYKLPLVEGGILAELIYKDSPTIVDEINVEPSDPGYEYVKGMGSLLALPLYDKGHALNMVISLREKTHAFDSEVLPEQVWMSNLFGRATQNLVLNDELQRAYDAVDRELRIVADIQHDLLPHGLPKLKTADMATHYMTSEWAGGDYYDFLPIDDHRRGVLLADVSGHGTPAAVFMAVTHSLAHAAPDPADPAKFLQCVNERLCRGYTNDSGRFVTAFYGVYDDRTRKFVYANAGHGPPRVRHVDGTVTGLGGPRSLPLGIDFEEQFRVSEYTSAPGETVVFYTDGVTETRNTIDELFGTDRLDAALKNLDTDATNTVRGILDAVNAFKGPVVQSDDVTLLAARIK
jgi:sigma-B regulation protein RsbU (phosphoserine phosphatase)